MDQSLADKNIGVYVLEIESVRKRLGGTIALDSVSFAAKPGECISVCGENGSGKSTLLSIVAGVMRADEGQVLWQGKPAHSRQSKLAHGCGYVPEAANPPMHLTVSDLLHLVQNIRNCGAIDKSERERLGLDEILGARLDQLSLGQRRRACLAAAFLGQPKLLVLDEPTNGLDQAGIETLGKILNQELERDAIIVLATHDMEFAACVESRRLVLEHGKFV